MTHTLDSLSRTCHELLAAGDTPAARQRVADALSRALADPAFVREMFARPVGERSVASQDSRLGFCILAHEYTEPREGQPHDHGPSWAIYGQAEGQSVMNEFAVVQPGSVRKLRSVTMRPGDTRVYDEGKVHAVTHTGPSRLVRVEGRDLTTVKRGTYRVID
jgi:hypothetical protein